MNPLDPLELQAFMRNLKEEMPIHTDTTAKIKRSYSQGMPKNLMEYSAHVDNKFLNENLAIIEEMHHRDQIHPIPLWFRNYQLKHYFRHGILNRDGFFASRMRDGFLKPDLFEARWIGSHAMMNFKNVGFTSVIGNSKVFGSDLTTGDTSTNTTGTQGSVRAMQLSIGIVGQYYDRVACNVQSAAGNMRLAIYDDNSNPNNLYEETESHAAVTGFNWNAVTEFALNATVNWAAFQSSSSSNSLYYKDLAGSQKAQSQAFGAFPNPFGSPSGTFSPQYNMKVGHS